MKPYHQVTGLHFAGNMMILTIDGQEKRFQVSDISPTLQQASEQERSLLKYLRQAMAFIGHYSTRDLSVIDGLLGVVHEPQKTTKRA